MNMFQMHGYIPNALTIEGNLQYISVRNVEI